MGQSIFHCSTDYTITTAPNPSPDRWMLLGMFTYTNGYVLVVRYLDCNTFEGEKIMVYAGDYVHRNKLDPHFKESMESPIARFKPGYAGLKRAKALAKSL